MTCNSAIYVITCLSHLGMGRRCAALPLTSLLTEFASVAATHDDQPSVIGGFVGGIVWTIIFVPLGGSAAPPTLGSSVLLFIIVAAFEEAGRLLAIHWLLERASPRLTLPDSLMFGAGFGGAEVIFRAGQAAHRSC